MVRYLYSDEASSPTDLTLKGDLAESWEGNSDYRVWTFKLKRGVKWHNMPPVNGRELVAADIKYCFEAYAKEGVQAFTFGEIEDIETPDKYTVRVHLKSPNTMFPQNLAEPVAVIFPKEVLEEDGDLKKRMIGTGPFMLKEHTRKVRAVLVRNPDYFEKGTPYVDEYHILSTPDAATRLAAFRTGQSDIHWMAGLGDAEHAQEDQPQRRDPVPQERADRVRSRAGAGQAALQGRPGAPGHLHGHRPPEAAGHGVRGARHPRLGRALHLLPGHAAHGRCSSGPTGSTGRPRPRSSWPRPGTRMASRPRCSTTSTSRR